MGKNIIIIIVISLLLFGIYLINLNEKHYEGNEREVLNEIIKDFNSDCENNWTVYVDNLDTPNDEHIKIYNGKLCDFNILVANMIIPYSHGRITAIKDAFSMDNITMAYNLSAGRMTI